MAEPQQDDAAGRLRAIIGDHVPNSGDFFELDDDEVADLREVLRQLDDAKARNRELTFAQVDASELRKRSRSTNDLARQLADRTDELATLQQKFDDFRDVCSAHSADRVVEQVRLEDAEAALVRYGNEMTRLATAADAFRRERDELRAEVGRLTRGRDEVRDGDEAVSHEWATRTPDGTRTRWDDEWRAFRFARHHPDVKVEFREIRHFVGRWKPAPDAAEAPPSAPGTGLGGLAQDFQDPQHPWIAAARHARDIALAIQHDNPDLKDAL